MARNRKAVCDLPLWTRALFFFGQTVIIELKEQGFLCEARKEVMSTMRMTDRRGVEYDVTYDAERRFYVYMKVFKPWPEPNFMGEPAPAGDDDGQKNKAGAES